MQQPSPFSRVSRRAFMQAMPAGLSAFWLTPGLFAEQLLQTPRMTEGPFYPDKLPLDTDNDLLVINDSLTPAVGEIVHLSGRVLSAAGEPIRNAFVEIWQVDNNAAYIHSGTGNADKQDKNFQGYGRFMTDSTGVYYFRTIKPVPYPGRTPHIHVAVSRNGKRLLTTQFLITGHPQNERDGVFRSVTDPELRKTVLMDLKPVSGSQIGELETQLDLVLGHTLQEAEDGTLRGGIGRPEFRPGRRS